MIIYHGSTELVENPEIRINNTFLDFGTVLYYHIKTTGRTLGKN